MAVVKHQHVRKAGRCPLAEDRREHPLAVAFRTRRRLPRGLKNPYTLTGLPLTAAIREPRCPPSLPDPCTVTWTSSRAASVAVFALALALRLLLLHVHQGGLELEKLQGLLVLALLLLHHHV